MINLAGHPEADRFILLELALAGIDVVEHAANIPHSEVPTRITGRLGSFEFRRLWYYYAVHGRVPLAVAEELYADAVGRRDVRVAGHCGCPPPREWATHVDADGMRVREDPDGSQERETQAFLDVNPHLRDALAERYVRSFAEVQVESFVECYHIDSQEGLNLFCETLRRRGLVDGGAR